MVSWSNDKVCSEGKCWCISHTTVGYQIELVCSLIAQYANGLCSRGHIFSSFSLKCSSASPSLSFVFSIILFILNLEMNLMGKNSVDGSGAMMTFLFAPSSSMSSEECIGAMYWGVSQNVVQECLHQAGWAPFWTCSPPMGGVAPDLVHLDLGISASSWLRSRWSWSWTWSPLSLPYFVIANLSFKGPHFSGSCVLGATSCSYLSHLFQKKPCFFGLFSPKTCLLKTCFCSVFSYLLFFQEKAPNWGQTRGGEKC